MFSPAVVEPLARLMWLGIDIPWSFHQSLLQLFFIYKILAAGEHEGMRMEMQF